MSSRKSQSLLIADAGPLIALARLNRLDLLRELYAKVLVPDVVLAECVAGNKPGASAIADAVERCLLTVESSPSNPPLSEAMRASLGPGETAAIALARSFPQSWLLIDDAIGRRIAESFGLRVVGVLGVLVTGRKKGLVPKLGPILDELAATGYYVSPLLLQTVLEAVGER